MFTGRHLGADPRGAGQSLRVSAAHAASLTELSYPLDDGDILVTACGRICIHRKNVNISTVLAGQRLGIVEAGEGIRLVSFIHDGLG